MNDYIKQHSDRFLNELKEFLKIPSISADSAFKNDIEKAADFLVDALTVVGLDTISKFYEGGNPIVYAEKIVSADLPTIIIYGHYDVQPADPIELWNTPPFEPTIIDGKIFARGACDDKSQVYLIIKALECLNEQGQYPCNIKLVFEGEEEIGSVSFKQFVLKHKTLLKADTLLVCDTSMPSINKPTLICGLRGISFCEIEVTGAEKDLHSGMYGGTIVNPLFELTKVLSKLKDENEHITIPGFYDNIIETDPLVKKIIEQNTSISDLFPTELTPFLNNIKQHSIAEQMTIQPTLDINGIWGGYIGEGPKTVIPSKANAKLSMRLVAGQNHETITKKLETYLKDSIHSKVKISLTQTAGCNAVNFSPENASTKAASIALETIFGNKPLYTYIGGTIPPVAIMAAELQVTPVLMGFGLDSDNIHSPNESFLLENFFKGIETVTVFLNEYQKQHSLHKQLQLA
jgi:acetylornithine deacetylase/succinyl-diaminopimelate desuccinylase-like protein